MLCKENVVSWFGNLSSYKRIDVMCTLLNMCLPFEVRYLGTYVEDLGKRDYNFLRDTEFRANNVGDLAELVNLGVTDKRTRRKLALYMALLHACNYSCAIILFKRLADFDFQEISNFLNGTNFTKDDQPLEELLLLYAMALNHPAFNFEQKSTFGNIFLKLQEEETRFNLPKPHTETLKPSQGVPCIPCGNQNERIDSDIQPNCGLVTPPIQTFQNEIPIRANTVLVPPGMCLAPTGICPPPNPEQMNMIGAGQPQFVHIPHVSFPSVNHMPPWSGQVMMAHHNQFLYHSNEVLPYSNSPSVSRQSSPTQSQSHSRSNSPTGQQQTQPQHQQQQLPAQQKLQRKSNNGNNNNIGLTQQPRTSCQTTQTTLNTVTTSIPTSSSLTNITSSPAMQGVATSLPPLPSMSSSRSHLGHQQQQQQQPHIPLMTMRPLAPINTTSYTRQNSVELNTTNIKQAQHAPPPRLKPSLSGESLRETTGKEMPNFKGNFQNSISENRRLSDEDLLKSDITSNALNNLKSQSANGLTQNTDKKIDDPNVHTANEIMENENLPIESSSNDNSNTKPTTIPDQTMMNCHPAAMTNRIRYPPPPPTLDPTHISMFSAPPTMYPTQNACYGCLTTVPMGVPNRFSRGNSPQIYCLTQLQALRLEPENNRQCSQSSSSDSTGSRSPPETPPVAPWLSNEVTVPLTPDEQQSPHLGIVQLPPPPPQPRAMRKNQSHIMRNKNHSAPTIVNGGTPMPQPVPTSLQPCMTFSAPQGPSPMPAYLAHHTHFPALRPTSGIYSNFPHAAYARPAPAAAGFHTIAPYTPNGEMMYQYPGHPPPGNSANVVSSTGTPPPPPPAVAAAAAATAVQSTSNPIQQQQTPQQHPPTPPQQQQQAMQPPPTSVQPNYVSVAPVAYVPLPPPAKISCYNCGSNNHMASDCKEQTMEDITRGAQYRLDYATIKPSGSDQSQSSEK